MKPSLLNSSNRAKNIKKAAVRQRTAAFFYIILILLWFIEQIRVT